MKNIINILIILIFTWTLAACSDKTQNNEQTNNWWNNVEIQNNQQQVVKQTKADKKASIQNIKVVDTDEFEKEIMKKGAILIDLRTPKELKESWVINPKAINLDVYNPSFSQKINQLDKNKTYLIYCRSGARSARVREYMRKLWFKNVIDLQWWIINWNNSWKKLYP